MLTKEDKEKLIKEFGKSATDTGSSPVQIMLLTERIKQIAEHLQSFPKDKHSRAGLVKLVGARRTLCNYLKRQDFAAYNNVMGRLKK